ncbi:FAD-dependent oxidoreductase [Corynebacterium poyangense]|uniref:FAD-dependent oxidoreductase n=1 Tax=Corynebacterium poyangense TaxID=2684405 RepID=A0A7H0SQI6_9CORY|nr:FAD-dependent oxidoreductase [Corynebacterium poyangense]QNQ90811.1 FAD-dependent oxidoreductase [Corynebacterium poyangense]
MLFSSLSELPNREKQLDVLVIGSGAAGMVSALRVSQNGKSVLVVEKSSFLGGTTAAGGGVSWIPNNHLMEEAGWIDDVVAAKEYLAAVTNNLMSETQIDWYVNTGRRFIHWLIANSRVRLQPLSRPDYHGSAPGAKTGRGLDNAPFDLKPWPEVAEILRPPTYFPLISMAERDQLSGALPDQELLEWRAANNIRTMGGALAGALIVSALEKGVDIVRGTSVKSLHRISDSEYEVTLAGDIQTTIVSRNVIIASGGFEWNSHLRENLLPYPITPISAPSNEGDGLYLALKLGADIENTQALWGVPVICPPDSQYDGVQGGRMGNVEMTLPGAILINSKGKRFINEALNYHDLNRIFINTDPATGDWENIPAWLIVDDRYIQRYSLSGSTPGKPLPWFIQRGSLKELAGAIQVDGQGLEDTVSNFNRHAVDGKDPEFHRGETDEDRHLGDPRQSPNPCLAPLKTPPFYAVQIYPGTLGTAGGIKVSLDGRVLDPEGNPIPGLWAAGNCSSTIFQGAYPGGGATLGAAMVRAFAVAESLTRT